MSQRIPVDVYIAIRASACGYKAKFFNKSACKLRCTQVTRETGIPLRPYHCQCCQWWHMTSKVRRKFAERCARIVAARPGVA